MVNNIDIDINNIDNIDNDVQCAFSLETKSKVDAQQQTNKQALIKLPLRK